MDLLAINSAGRRYEKLLSLSTGDPMISVVVVDLVVDKLLLAGRIGGAAGLLEFFWIGSGGRGGGRDPLTDSLCLYDCCRGLFDEYDRDSLVLVILLVIFVSFFARLEICERVDIIEFVNSNERSSVLFVVCCCFKSVVFVASSRLFASDFVEIKLTPVKSIVNFASFSNIFFVVGTLLLLKEVDVA